MNKNEIRQLIKEFKKCLNNLEKVEAASTVAKTIEDSIWFKRATHILIYHSLPDELHTHNLLNRWADKKLYLPRVNGHTLDILPIDKIRLGAFNIYEPIGNKTVSLSTIDLAIIPGVAFDKCGSRIGRGKGFYDRLLQDNNIFKIGIGYDFQLFDNIPSAPHDIKMDAIITPHNKIVINDKFSWQ
ncbi:MAG: 5-formyltetrahydrofolate cyclo-ligase [Muribaculaceae bacterium]|nr:5-formyltetrahydrofolate cyclo-ligase [Muribaculaceae bacterium]